MNLRNTPQILLPEDEDQAPSAKQGGDTSENILARFDKRLRKNPNDVGMWFAKSVFLMKEGNYEDAIETIERIVELDEGHRKAWENKGGIHLRLGQLEEALVCYDNLLKLDPGDEVIWTRKGNVLTRLCRYEEAKDCYDRAIDINSGYTDAWYGRGDVIRRMGKNADGPVSKETSEPAANDAYESFKEASRLDPQNCRGWEGMGEINLDRTKYGKAVADFDRALSINPESTKALWGKGRAMGSLGDHSSARELIKRAAEVEPRGVTAKDPLSWHAKANALELLDRHEKALGCYQNALELDINDQVAMLRKGALLSKLGRHEEALAWYDKVLEVHSNDQRLWSGRGDVLRETGEHHEALSSYERAIAIRPEYWPAWFGTGEVYLALEQVRQAVHAFEQVLAFNPGHDAARERLSQFGHAVSGVPEGPAADALPSDLIRDFTMLVEGAKQLAMAGDHAQALEQCDSALQLNDADPLLWKLKAESEAAMGMSHEAVASLQRALDIDPDLKEVRRLLSELLLQIGNVRDALETFNKAECLTPLFYGGAVPRPGDGDPVLKEAAAGTGALRPTRDDGLPPPGDPFCASLNKARWWKRHRKPGKALEAVEEALKLSPEDVDALSLKADVLFDLGRYHEASDLLEVVIRIRMGTDAENGADEGTDEWAAMMRDVVGPGANHDTERFPCPKCGRWSTFGQLSCEKCGATFIYKELGRIFGDIFDVFFLFEDIRSKLAEGDLAFFAFDGSSGEIEYLEPSQADGEYYIYHGQMELLSWCG